MFVSVEGIENVTKNLNTIKGKRMNMIDFKGDSILLPSALNEYYQIM
jgi:hypothetical protein